MSRQVFHLPPILAQVVECCEYDESSAVKPEKDVSTTDSEESNFADLCNYKGRKIHVNVIKMKPIQMPQSISLQ